MALSRQSIRKGMVILLNNKPATKDEIIALSENWSETKENFFRKMLQQGGEFSMGGNKFNVVPREKILTSRGEMDAGVIQIPGDDSRF